MRRGLVSFTPKRIALNVLVPALLIVCSMFCGTASPTDIHCWIVSTIHEEEAEDRGEKLNFRSISHTVPSDGRICMELAYTFSAVYVTRLIPVIYTKPMIAKNAGRKNN